MSKARRRSADVRGLTSEAGENLETNIFGDVHPARSDKNNYILTGMGSDTRGSTYVNHKHLLFCGTSKRNHVYRLNLCVYSFMWKLFLC